MSYLPACLLGIDAIDTAAALSDAGFSRVHHLAGGLAGWGAAGGPIADGPCCIPPGISCDAPPAQTNQSRVASECAALAPASAAALALVA